MNGAFDTIVADAVGRFAVHTEAVMRLLARLKERGDYRDALLQFNAGATDRVVGGMLERALREITGAEPEV